MRLRRARSASTHCDLPESLSIHLTDFGPISAGRVDIRPLTVLIGPNNSGKSYTAALTRAFFSERVDPSAWGSAQWMGSAAMLLPAGFGDQIRAATAAGMARLVGDVRSSRMSDCIPIDRATVVKPIWSSLGQFIYGDRLQAVLERYFGCAIRDLIRFDQFRLGVRFQWSAATAEIDSHYKKKLRAVALPDAPARSCQQFARDSVNDQTPKTSEIHVVLDSPPPDEVPDEVIRRVIENGIILQALPLLAPALLWQAHYLPAARSGILQGHRALAAAYVEAAPLVGVKPVSVPRLSGLASDFISTILQLPPDFGPFADIAEEFETKIIEGHITSDAGDEAQYPEIVYDSHGQQIPLRRSSSTVSELAPIFLYLKHVVKVGDLLIIEEPEAHLHPENQRLLGALLVRLVNSGLRVMITTHSEFLLQELNNRLLMGRMQPTLLWDTWNATGVDTLRRVDLSVVRFHRNPLGDGWQISPVAISDEEGISEEEFLCVHEGLYEDTLILERHLAGSENE